MIVQELLKEVDAEALADIRQIHMEEWEKPLHSPRKIFVRNMRGFAKMLQTLAPDPTPYDGEEADGGFVMYLLPFINSLEDYIDVRYQADYVKRKDFNAAVDEIRKAGTMPTINLNDANKEEMESFLKKTDNFVPQGYGYEFTPWEKVLAAEIVPGAFSVLNDLDETDCKNLFLYDLLWEMSFNGYTRECQEERMAELDKSIKEMEEIKKLPEEEQKKYYCDADDFFKKLYEEAGLEYHERTEEEKEKERLGFLTEYCMSRSMMLDVMWKLARKA